jgi:hypothetical protein
MSQLLSFLRSLRKTSGLLTTIVLAVVVVLSNISISTELLGVAQDPKVVDILGCLKC